LCTKCHPNERGTTPANNPSRWITRPSTWQHITTNSHKAAVQHEENVRLQNAARVSAVEARIRRDQEDAVLQQSVNVLDPRLELRRPTLQPEYPPMEMSFAAEDFALDPSQEQRDLEEQARLDKDFEEFGLWDTDGAADLLGVNGEDYGSLGPQRDEDEEFIAEVMGVAGQVAVQSRRLVC
jgi:hypothetical protein